MSTINLRPYQQDFIDAVRNEFLRGNRRVVGVAPCGAGKTIMTGWMIRESLNRGKRSIFFVHRKELIDQTAATFKQLGIPHGIIAADVPMQLELPVQIASVQTLARRIDKIPVPDFLICDECHHVLANTYKKILDAFPKAFLLGVTATPQRLGGINLDDVFSSMVQSLSVNELIALGNLTKFHYFVPEKTIDLSGVRSGFGEYNQADLADVMSDKTIIGDIVEDYLRHANGKSAICYCVNVEHSKNVAKAFRDAGIAAAHCDGDTPKVLRAKIVSDFRRDKIKVLCNAELFGEGFDVPHCQAVILARPTQSLTLYIQQSMRPLRPDPADPNKVAVIIDHVRNYLKHGLPNDDRQWSLEPKPKEISCPNCGKWIVPIERKGKKFCPKCGFEFAKGAGQYTPPRKIENAAGQVVELDINFDTKKTSSEPTVVSAPKTPEEFSAIAKKFRYKTGWVAYRACEFATSYDDFLHIAKVCGYKTGWAWHQWQKHLSGLRD